MNIIHHNPDTLHKNPAFSQAVTVEGAVKMVYVGGQNGITVDGKLAGNALKSQTEQTLKNILEALKAVGASQENVVKLTIYIVNGQDISEAFAASQKMWGLHPTTISVLVVAGLAIPGALVEIDAVAAVGT